MMASKYKYIYFNTKALGEPIRFLLAYLDTDYEDYRFSEQEWPAIKPTTPWGRCPVLEVEGKGCVTQHVAITRYLGRLAGLNGADPWEDLRIDEIVDVINELRLAFADYHYEKDERHKIDLKKPLFEETVPFHMSRLEAHAKKNGGFMANGKFSWADIYFAGVTDYFTYMFKSDILNGYPTLTSIRDRVFNIPKIKEWIAKRPVTPS